MSAEQWRPLVAKYFRPEDVDKALYVIDHESGGNPAAVGDNGTSHGLFQLNNNGLGSGMPVADRLNPEKNIATAAQAVYGGSGWKPWGEGSLYQGRPFGSLGNNPYGGGSTVGNSATSASDQKDYQDFLEQYVGARPKLEDYTDQPGQYGLTKQQQLDADLKTYNAAVKSATGAYSSYRTAIGKGVTSPDQKAQQAVTNLIAALDLQVRAGQLDASQAATKLNAFINEQKNALDLGQQQLTANAEMDKYGPGGNWNYNNAGAGFADYAKRNGLDPNSSAIAFTTPTPFDPAAAFAKNIQTMGGGNGPPGEAAPSSASQRIAALIAGMQSANTQQGTPNGGVPTWGTGPGGPYIAPTGVTPPNPQGDPLQTGPNVATAIRPPGVDQNGNPVAPPPLVPPQEQIPGVGDALGIGGIFPRFGRS